MSTETPINPEYDGRPLYGYDSPDVQEHYTTRYADGAGSVILPHLSSGMNVLDCGCGPGTITLGLAEAVAPGRAVGIDLEPNMVERAKSFASENGVDNVEFRVADIYDLPFEDGEFDVVFSCAVTEHLAEPVTALKEVRRVVKSGGLVGIVRTDWSDPFIVPENESVSRFLELFEGGFNRYGGSLNRGRHLRSDMKEAGFEIVEFEGRLANYRDYDSVKSVIEGYIAWMDNLPLFRESIELGITTQEEIDSIRAGMREWNRHPDAYYANAHTYVIGRK